MKLYTIKHKKSGKYYSGYIEHNCTEYFDENEIKLSTNQEYMAVILSDITDCSDVSGISYNFMKEDFIMVEFDITEKEILD